MKNLIKIIALVSIGVFLLSCKKEIIKPIEKENFTEKTSRKGGDNKVEVTIMLRNHDDNSNTSLDITSSVGTETVSNIVFSDSVHNGQTVRVAKVTKYYSDEFAQDNNILLFEVNTNIVNDMFIYVELNDNMAFHEEDVPSVNSVENSTHLETYLWFDNGFNDSKFDYISDTPTPSM